MPKFSIIIPVYNVEKYIDGCLKSVMNQTYKDYEVIVVNDGTKDNSMDIVKKYDVKVIEQKNQGLSAARNTGVKHAKGDYLIFLDSDDSWNKDLLKELSKSIKNNPDVVRFQIQETYENSDDVKPFNEQSFEDKNGVERNLAYLLNKIAEIENYPGFLSISGSELANNLYNQVIELGGEIEIEEVLSVKFDEIKTVTTDMGEYQAKSIIFATGSKFRTLGLDREEEFIGNGISFIILIGIIARLPQSLFQEVVSRLSSPGAGGIVMFLIEIVFLLFVIAFAILLVQGVRKVPVQYAKRIVGNKQYGGARQYIPLKVNAANVMPIIFAQAIMFIPITLVGYTDAANASGVVRALVDHTSFGYNLVFALLIILFTYFYTAITINPTQMAEDMKRNNGFIPGIKPGKNTAEYLDTIMSRITLPGSLFLALIAVLPAFAGLFGVQPEFAQFFGGTSLLILVGVVLDTLQQVESHLLMRHYDGLLSSGRIKGRSANVAAY